jgi:hypothetical protein
VKVTERQLNRATLDRQLLLRRERLDAVVAVHRVVALQAQAPVSPYIALWNRVEGFDPADLDRAFAEHLIVKATLMRVTMHAVEASDYAAFHEAVRRTLRGARLHDPRFKVAGLTIPEAEALIPHLIDFMSRPRTSAEVEAWLDDRIGVRPRPGVWWALRHYGPFVHAPIGRPWSFGTTAAYLGAREQRRPGDEDAAMQHLIRRYLEGFGPATAQDIHAFGMIHAGPIKQAIASMDDGVVRLEGPGRSVLFDLPDRSLPPEDAPAPPRLLGMWDEVLLAYENRSRIIPPGYRKLVNRMNGDVLPTLLVDGYVAGVWRPVDGGIEATAFHDLPQEAWQGLESEARGLVAFLADRDPKVYSRYGHWWEKIPKSFEVRVLGA